MTHWRICENFFSRVDTTQRYIGRDRNIELASIHQKTGKVCVECIPDKSFIANRHDYREWSAMG
jgi:hypothetical protein